MIKAIARVIVAFNTNVKKEQIALGAAWGLMLGLVPTGNLLWVLLLVVAVFIRQHHGMLVLFIFVGRLLAALIVPVVDAIGFAVLTAPLLYDFWTFLYNLPLIPLSNFNNTLVLGGFILSIAMFLPVFFVVRGFVPFYRMRVVPAIIESKFYKALIRIPVVAKLRAAVSVFSRFAGV
ncbi:TIGR03546 family protein [Spirochaetia bacterium 38H-sp]|uniref:TIGR03546 family protein n=1 Tax=Rarispira pelagica TaxID=3141764 RepID=A0ABU9UBI1_9SPIR